MSLFSRASQSVGAVETSRLTLSVPQHSDLPALHAILSDPMVWLHYPSLRHTSMTQTRSHLDSWIAAWQTEALAMWTVRRRGEERVIGYGGCTLVRNQVWNLGYRFAAAAHGFGYATELAHAALEHAALRRSDLPITAYLLEHNLASANVARKVGLSLVHRSMDLGNPDLAAVRLIYADRPLTEQQLAVTLR